MAHDFTVIGVAETNIESRLKDLYSIPGYELIYQEKMCRKKKGSGFAMYVHKDINFMYNKEMFILTSDIEVLFINIYNETGSSTVGTIYRPPNGDYTKFIESLTKIMSISDNREDNVIIMGDFNINLFIDNKQRSSFEETTMQ